MDKFGGKELIDLRDKYQKLYAELSEIDGELNGLISDDEERQRLLDLYKFQIDEIDEAAFEDGEEEALKEFRNQVLHQEKIIETLNNIVNICSGDGYEYLGVKDTLKKSENLLSGITAYGKEFEEIGLRLESLRMELEDISDTLADKRDNMYIDEAKAKANEERLDLLSDFKKKYGADIVAINAYRDKISNIYNSLVGAEDRLKKLKSHKVEIADEMIKTAKTLSQMRKNTAKILEKQIKSELIDLGMKNSNFSVCFNDLDFENRNSFGLDRVEFMFTANLGEPLKPLKDVASGGEMSRLMLAIKNITAKIDEIGTLIFDEIDIGVSGINALSLAQKLSAVSRFAQVICVTHLAQVASYGDINFLIEKFEKDGKTTTQVNLLNEDGCVKEIARLISGKITDNAVRSAQEMIENARNFKKNLI